MENGKIIFVEDNIHDAELIRLSFLETRFRGELIRFDSGISFLEYMQNENPANIRLVLLDMEMPCMTGLQTLSKLNSLKLKSFPVVFFSTSLNQRNITEAKALKADAYISKSTDLDEFQKTISDIWRFYGELNEFTRCKSMAMI